MHKPNSIFAAAAGVLFREAVETSAEDEKVIALVKKAFPSGSKPNAFTKELEWSKSGGYAGEKSLKATREKLEKLGFKYGDSKLFGLPDGSTTGSSIILGNKKLGWYVTLTSFYGQTAARNSFSLKLKKLPTDSK